MSKQWTNDELFFNGIWIIAQWFAKRENESIHLLEESMKAFFYKLELGSPFLKYDSKSRNNLRKDK